MHFFFLSSLSCVEKLLMLFTYQNWKVLENVSHLILQLEALDSHTINPRLWQWLRRYYSLGHCSYRNSLLLYMILSVNYLHLKMIKWQSYNCKNELSRAAYFLIMPTNGTKYKGKIYLDCCLVVFSLSRSVPLITTDH